MASHVIFDAKLMKEHTTSDDPWAATWLSKNTAGYGSHTLSSYVPDQELVFEPYSGFRGDFQPQKVTLKIIPTSENRVSLMERKQLDLAAGLPPKEVNYLKDKQGIKTIGLPTNQQTYLSYNTNTKPFENKLVRQALNYAIPYDRCVKEALFGLADKAGGPVMKHVPGYDPQILKNYDTDLERAKSLLDQAGLSQGFSSELYYSDEYPFYDQMAGLLKESFSQIGVDVTLRKLTLSAYSERMVKHELPLFLLTGWPWIPDAGYWMRLVYTTKGVGNYWNYSNPEVDSIIDKWFLGAEPDRTKELQKAAAMVIDDAAAGWIVEPFKTMVFKESVKGYLYTAEDSDGYFMLNKSE